MPIYNSAIRNDFCNVMDVFDGGTIQFLDESDNVLAQSTLPATAWENPVDGVKQKAGQWQAVGNATAGVGTPCTAVRLTGGGRQMDLTAGGPGSGAEAIITNDAEGTNHDVIVEGAIVTVVIASFTHPTGV